ncbi:Protein-glutamate methylesterase/protein-glutamine glutaminase [subsurface metagenome]
MINYNKRQPESTRNKATTLIVDGHPVIRQALTRLINEELDLGVCAEAEDANQALDAIEKQQFDFAVVDISEGSKANIQLAEAIKLQCPDLPILILSMHNEALYSKGTSFQQGPRDVENQDVIEQIIEAIRYVQSLLRSRVFGFTVSVKIERSG